MANRLHDLYASMQKQLAANLDAARNANKNPNAKGGESELTWLRLFDEHLPHGIKRPSAPILLSVAAKDWLELKAPTWAEKTHVNATLDVGHLKKHLGGFLLTDITDKDIADYITSRRTEKAADKTIRNEIGTLRGILKRHRLWAQLKDDGVRLPRGRDEDTGVALTTDQEVELLKAYAASRSRSLLPVVTLALSTGMRHDEMRLLRWRQVDSRTRRLR